ncbi:MAG: hypothetical protein KBG29_01550 [Pseudomonadales bacterium]|nr:hypothetical protein [Pseudomonadales bacterium]
MTRPIERWTPELDALLREHFPRMPFESLSFLLGRTISSLKNRANKLRLRRDADVSHASRQAAGKAGYAAARARQGGKPCGRKPPSPPPAPIKRPDLRETGPDQLAYRKRRLKEAAEAMVEHGVDPHAAELAVHAICKGRVPGVRFEI